VDDVGGGREQPERGEAEGGDGAQLDDVPGRLRFAISCAGTSDRSAGSTRPTASTAIRRAFLAVAS
jgi:hypothetical protein